MRKSLLLLFSCSIAGLTTFANIIDSLGTIEQVVSFVKSLNKDYNRVSIIPPKPASRQRAYDLPPSAFLSKAFEKIDLDKNGQTDLLFNGYADYYETNSTCDWLSLMIFSFPNDSFAVKNLVLTQYVDFFSARILKIDDTPYLNIEKVTDKSDDNGRSFHPCLANDTLAYLFQEFIDKSDENNRQIDKIEFCAWGGLGAFTGLKLVIINNQITMETGSAMHNPITALDSGGIFQSTFDLPVYSKLIGLTRHIDFTKLKQEYRVAWTDPIEGNLKISYADGTVLKINDSGLMGTYSLAALEHFLFSLKTVLHWRFVERESDFFIPVCDN